MNFAPLLHFSSQTVEVAYIGNGGARIIYFWDSLETFQLTLLVGICAFVLGGSVVCVIC